MTTAHDLEREDRIYAGVLDGPSEPGWVDEADTYTPEPFTAPKPTRVEGELCGRWVSKRRHGANHHPCMGRVTADGGCTDGCVIA